MKKNHEPIEPNELIADGLFDIAKSLRLLGHGNIDRGDNAVGSIEYLVMAMEKSNKQIASALDSVASAIQTLAQSVKDSK